MKDSQGKLKKSIFQEYLWKLLSFVIGDERKKINRGVLWSAIYATTTIVLLIYTCRQVSQVSIINKGEFLEKFGEEFFTPECREFTLLLEYDLIKFKENKIGVDTVPGLPQNFACFVKINKYPSKLNLFLPDSTKAIYSSYEMDDFLLGPFEDLGMHLKMGVVNVKEIYLNFGWYISLVWENEEIKKYINWNKITYPLQPSAHYIYSDYLYHQIKHYEKEHPAAYFKKDGQ